MESGWADPAAAFPISDRDESVALAMRPEDDVAAVRRSVRASPFGRVSVSRPPNVASSRHPALPASVPETVPLSNTSPGTRLQPLDVWCATICFTVQ
jgi:hypothetical protein